MNEQFNINQDLSWAQETSSNGNLGMVAKFKAVMKDISSTIQKIKDSNVEYYPCTFDLFATGADTDNPTTKRLTDVSGIIYKNNLFDKDGNQRMQVGQTYSGEINQAINPDGTAKDRDAWVTVSHLTATGNRLGRITFGVTTPQVTQEPNLNQALS
jgi:hypothetical protein